MRYYDLRTDLEGRAMFEVSLAIGSLPGCQRWRTTMESVRKRQTFDLVGNFFQK